MAVREKLDELDVKIIQLMADHNLNVTQTSDKVFMHRNTVVYHIEKIKRITGLDARKFCDLNQLLTEVAREYETE